MSVRPCAHWIIAEILFAPHYNFACKCQPPFVHIKAATWARRDTKIALARLCHQELHLIRKPCSRGSYLSIRYSPVLILPCFVAIVRETLEMQSRRVRVLVSYPSLRMKQTARNPLAGNRQSCFLVLPQPSSVVCEGIRFAFLPFL